MLMAIVLHTSTALALVGAVGARSALGRHATIGESRDIFNRSAYGSVIADGGIGRSTAADRSTDDEW